jgi:hypothetical protein
MENQRLGLKIKNILNLASTIGDKKASTSDYTSLKMLQKLISDLKRSDINKAILEEDEDATQESMQILTSEILDLEKSMATRDLSSFEM